MNFADVSLPLLVYSITDKKLLLNFNKSFLMKIIVCDDIFIIIFYYRLYYFWIQLFII